MWKERGWAPDQGKAQWPLMLELASQLNVVIRIGLRTSLEMLELDSHAPPPLVSCPFYCEVKWLGEVQMGQVAYSGTMWS